MQDKYGSILRSCRKSAGLTVAEVVDKLETLGYKIAPTTVYGYETDISAPKVSVFLALCGIYGVKDIIGTFGLPFSSPDTPLTLTPHEYKVILAYRRQKKAQEYVDKLLQIEPEVLSAKNAF